MKDKVKLKGSLDNWVYIRPGRCVGPALEDGFHAATLVDMTDGETIDIDEEVFSEFYNLLTRYYRWKDKQKEALTSN